MDFKLMHPADQLVMMMNRIYGYGMTTTSGGNLSILDDNGDIWITPSGIDKGTLTRADIMRVTPDGQIIGPHKPSIELPFHSQLYRTRPDIKAIVHAHPPALVAFSIVRKLPDTNLIPNVNQICGDIAYADYEIPGSKILGNKIAAVFEKGYNTVMMENHGVIVGHEDLFKAFKAFETLEFCARLEINARNIGTPKPLSDRDVKISNTKNNALMEEFQPKGYSSAEKEARAKMCKLISRSYDQRLFTSTQGTFSQRIDGNNFIITPYNRDRKYLEVHDLVRIENGKKEAGKNPSRSVMLHQYIYEMHPEINSVIIAHPPNIMAFAVTDVAFDSRTIPESYIQLRDVPKLPFGSSFLQSRLTAKELTPSQPVVLVQNDCVIATGDSLIGAFDKLEVAEYSAMAIISCGNLGEIVKINEQQVQDINKDFNLK